MKIDTLKKDLKLLANEMEQQGAAPSLITKVLDYFDTDHSDKQPLPDWETVAFAGIGGFSFDKILRAHYGIDRNGIIRTPNDIMEETNNTVKRALLALYGVEDFIREGGGTVLKKAGATEISINSGQQNIGFDNMKLVELNFEDETSLALVVQSSTPHEDGKHPIDILDIPDDVLSIVIPGEPVEVKGRLKLPVKLVETRNASLRELIQWTFVDYELENELLNACGGMEAITSYDPDTEA
jgi:hypothetical protein